MKNKKVNKKEFDEQLKSKNEWLRSLYCINEHRVYEISDEKLISKIIASFYVR